MISYNFTGFPRPSLVVRSTRQIAGVSLALTGVFALSTVTFSGGAFAKTPGKTYCYRGTCHRVKTLIETKALVGRDIKISASFYDSCSKDRFNNCGLTSSGEVYKPQKADNAASSILPDGTVALVWSETSGEALVLRINNAGPYWGNRKLDLSAAAARKLGITGVQDVTVRIVKAPTDTEARFQKNRSYDPVIGPLGKFASLELAQKAMSKIRSDGLRSAPSLASLDKPVPSTTPEVDVASLEEPVDVSAVSYEEEVRGRGLSLSRENGGIKLFKSNTEIPPTVEQATFGLSFVGAVDVSREIIGRADSKVSLKLTSELTVLRTAELSESEARLFLANVRTDVQSEPKELSTDKPVSLLAALSSFTINPFSMFNSETDVIADKEFSSSLDLPSFENPSDVGKDPSKVQLVSKKQDTTPSSSSEPPTPKKARSGVKVASLSSQASSDLKTPSVVNSAKKSSTQVKGDGNIVKLKKKET